MQDNLKTIWQRLTRREPACARYESLVSLYADGIASEKEAGLVEAHVAVCPECRSLLASIRVTSGAFADQPAPQMPAGLSERLRLAILQERLLEQTPASMPAPRAPRNLMPRLALAGTFATVLLAAVLVYNLHGSSHNGLYATKPNHVAVAPKTGPASPVTQPAPHGVTTTPAKIATATGPSEPVGIAPVIPHRKSPSGVERASSTSVELAQGGSAGVRSRATSVISHPEAPQSPLKSHNMIASEPTVSAGQGNHSPRNHSGVQEANVPSLPPTPDVHSDVHPSLPPAVNNSATGEQPTMDAAAPQPQPTPAAPADNSRVQLASLASRLHLDKSNAAVMAKVTASEQQPSAEYQPSLAIVGAGLR